MLAAKSVIDEVEKWLKQQEISYSCWKSWLEFKQDLLATS